jgi:predicted component of type VI protein secretion system
MALVTLQVLEGLERGQVYAGIPTPVTIGREDDNHIRLNDERVSRFHAKIQEDNGRIILTDLDSTNGTRVNGHPVQMRVLQVGDQLSIGLGDLLLMTVFPLVMRKAYGRPAGIAAIAIGLGKVFFFPGDIGQRHEGEGKPAPVVQFAAQFRAFFQDGSGSG